MNINEIEIASRRAWPALEEMETPLGVLRFAEGVSRRTNSMNPVFDRCFEPLQVMSSSESFFAARRQPSVIRVVATRRQLSASHSLLDSVLSESGYVVEAPTLVMLAELCSGDSRKQALVLERDQWLSAWHGVKGIEGKSLPVHKRMLSRVCDASLCLVRTDVRGKTLATAMAVVSNACLGIFGVATREHVRRQGLAQSLVAELMSWGYQQGARCAYLQVEAANLVARRLYENNGFREFYSYWYRSKTLNNSHHVEEK